MIQRNPASNVARFPSSATKLFVLDTNVLMHDPTCLFRFEEHDVYIPMAILEELDNNKKGMSEVARNARQASRYLDELVSGAEASIVEGIPIERHGDKGAAGKLFLPRLSLLVYLDHSHRDARDADQTILFVDDANLPDVTSFADVNWAGRTDHISTSDRANVIGVDLLTDDSILLRVDR